MAFDFNEPRGFENHSAARCDEQVSITFSMPWKPENPIQTVSSTLERAVCAYKHLKFYFSSFLQVTGRSSERLRSRDFVQIHSFQPSHSRIDTSSIEKIRVSF